MKVVILAGGLGTRLAEETATRPKPMVEVGGRPLVWHIMKLYAHHGFTDFVLCLGYRAEVVKDYFLGYTHLSSDLTVSLADGRVVVHYPPREDWTVTLVDTGPSTETGGRVRRVGHLLGGERFFLTYGDVVANIGISRLLAFHLAHGRLATLTAVRPPARFGHLDLDGECVTRFAEKPRQREGWVSAGFFVFEPAVLDYLEGDATVLERDPLERLARQGQLMAFRHEGFWQCMDTLRDVRLLNELWSSGRAPWKVWD